MNFVVVLWVVVLGSLMLNAAFLGRYAGRRFGPARRRKEVIRKCSLEELDKVFKAGKFGMTPEAEAHFISKGNLPVLGAVKDVEIWVLSVLAKKCRRIFEFGTCSGRTTYHLAKNSPLGAEIITLTLPPKGHSQYLKSEGDDDRASQEALEESVYSNFFYEGTDEAGKVKQLLMDSKQFDETPYLESCDLVFVDGSHAYSYVMSDTQKAMRMVKPGGLVIWHDYDLSPAMPKDVYRALNELSAKYPLRHVNGTAFVMYRKPEI